MTSTTTMTTSKIDSFRGPYAFLSNFFHQAATPIFCDMGIAYSNVEAAFQAQKSLSPQDRAEIAVAGVRPNVAKRLGRKVELRPFWDIVRLKVMEDCLRQKFADPDLRRLLLATGEAELIEGNTWNDTFWGVCRGKGLNNLGKLLMKLRSEFREFERVGAVGDS